MNLICYFCNTPHFVAVHALIHFSHPVMSRLRAVQMRNRDAVRRKDEGVCLRRCV
jgi:hypothetical protein